MSAMALGIALVAMLAFAQIIGWRALSRTFPVDPAPPGEPLRSDGVVLGAWGWNAPPLRVSLDDVGVRLFPRRPFDLAFRPVCIPWPAITSVGLTHFLLFDVIEIRYGSAPSATIGFVSSPAADAVAREAVARGALPPPS